MPAYLFQLKIRLYAKANCGEKAINKGWHWWVLSLISIFTTELQWGLHYYSYYNVLGLRDPSALYADES